MGRWRRAGQGWQWRGLGLTIGLGVMVMVGLGLAADDPTTELGSGRYPAAYAIRGAKVVASPGKVIEPGTVVIRRGVIEAVGADKDVAVPFDAETIDGKGLVVYPGFIDLYTTVGQQSGIERSATGRGRLVDLSESPLASTPTDNRRGLTPEFQVAGALDLNDALAEPRRRLGFTDFLSAPAGAIATGQSALVSLTGLPRRDAIVASPVALHINPAPPFEPAGPSTKSDTPPAFFPGRRRMGEAAGPIENPYPRVLMGSVAHLRQAMLDAEHLVKLEAFAAEHGGPTPPFDPALKALAAARAKKLPVWWEANSEDEIHRALDLADEFGTTAVIVGGREAGKVVDRLKAHKIPVILRLSVPEEPKVPTEAEYRKKPAAERDEPLRAIAHRRDKWKEQLATASVLAKQGIPFALATDGITRLEDVPANLRKLIGHGLRPDDALAALTSHSAAIAGVEKRLGTIEPGKLGHVVVMTAPFNEERAKVKFVLVDGLKFEIKADDARAKGKGAGGRGGRPGGRGPASEKSSEEDQPDETAPPAKKAAPAAAPGIQKGQPGPDAKPGWDDERKALLQKIDALQKEKDASQDTINKLKARAGEIPRGENKKAEARPRAENAKPATPGSRSIKSETTRPQEPKKAANRSETPKKADTPKTADTPNKSEPPFVDVATELDSDRKPTIQTGGSVLIKDATILTVTHGTIPRGSILIEKGKITAVGADVKAPAGIKVIEAAGLVAMPGIIDTHSHIAIQGGVNEGTLSVVPEVRVKDVVTGDDVAIYRAIAGGTTTARLLHGSANTIGGQDAVAKLKYGRPGRDLIIRDGPQGVKFALGENVTRSPRRFPNTRMGVQSVIEKSFEEARAYRATWDAYRKGGAKPLPPPRVDLRLEALAAILDGKIRIHSHCYRSDEILMLLGTAQKYGVRVQSLQHVLEGYKVAAEIAAHGASASTFSDWWAY